MSLSIDVEVKANPVSKCASVMVQLQVSRFAFIQIDLAFVLLEFFAVRSAQIFEQVAQPVMVLAVLQQQRDLSIESQPARKFLVDWRKMIVAQRGKFLRVERGANQLADAGDVDLLAIGRGLRFKQKMFWRPGLAPMGQALTQQRGC